MPIFLHTVLPFIRQGGFCMRLIALLPAEMKIMDILTYDPHFF